MKIDCETHLYLGLLVIPILVNMSQPKSKNYHFSFYLFKWILILLICLFSFGLITKPVRKAWSYNYLEKGDEYLGQKRYESATLEYKKALLLYWKRKDLQNKIFLAKAASTDVLKLEDFYKERKILVQTDLIEQIKTVPKDEVSAVKLAKEMMEKGEFQYAVVAAKNGTEMDRNYRDAWLYLGIANLNCIKMLELSNSVRSTYKENAEKALERAREIDPEYQPAKDYTAELDRIN